MARALSITALVATAAARYHTDAELRAAYGITDDAALQARIRSLSPLHDHDAVKRAAANVTLRQAAAGKGIFVGAALNCGSLQNASDPNYVLVGNAQYNLATAENSCKFTATEPSRGSFNFSCCSTVAKDMISTAQGVFRGHNFVWGTYNPTWLTNGNFDNTTLVSIMQNHIANVAGNYVGQFYSWDVVNEAVSDSGSSILKPMDPWYPAVPDYIDIAFAAARATDAKVKLFYNDYGAEDMGTKSDKVYTLVSGMKQRGVPIDGVGLQMHISVDGFPDPRAVAANIARLGALGLEVHITEMDVRCTPPCGADRLNLQAQVYGNILQACVNNTNCKSFETWGFTDLHTWLWSFNNPNHVNMQPLPFDMAYNPKPAFYELLAVLQA